MIEYLTDRGEFVLSRDNKAIAYLSTEDMKEVSTFFDKLALEEEIYEIINDEPSLKKLTDPESIREIARIAYRNSCDDEARIDTINDAIETYKDNKMLDYF